MFSWLKRKPAPTPEPRAAASFFSTHAVRHGPQSLAAEILADARRRLPRVEPQAGTMDAIDGSWGLKLTSEPNSVVNSALMNWYAYQSFIGWQACALLMQNWLIDKAVTMPARDATRNGWDIARTDGEDLDDEHKSLLEKADKAFRLKWNTEQLIRMGRAFGVRLAWFKVESDDPDYYENPFNPDGVTEGSYKGIAQIDPYWAAPILDSDASGNPGSIHFYEPTWWMIGSQKVHRSHLHIFRTSEPPDILKPLYLYGGIPTTQLIMERVYAAERTANEAPLLAQSKRTNVWRTDIAAFRQAGDAARQNLAEWVEYRDNYGIKIGDKEADDFQQFDTSLADLDDVCMSQYQLVAAAAQVPATKLLGTTPKGFNSTGDYEEANYHEFLETLQEHDLTPLLERHHLLTLRSHGIKDVETTVTWRPLDAPTAKELADTNLVKAQTDAALIQAGVIDGEDARKRLATDPESGYAQLGNTEEDLGELGLSPDGIAAVHSLGLDDDESGRWITINGAHVLVDENGTIVGGAGGKFNGQRLGVRDHAPNEVAPHHAAAIKEYTGASYRKIQGHLRGGKDIDESGRQHIAHLDELLNSASLPEDRVVHRGLGSLAVEQLLGPSRSVKKGDILHDHGFMSTSGHEHVARQFFNQGRNNVLMSVKMPKGSKALDISKHSDAPSEAETLVARGAKMKVVKWDQKARKLEVELMPHDWEPPAKGGKKTGDAADAAIEQVRNGERFAYEDASGLTLISTDDPEAETFFLGGE